MTNYISPVYGGVDSPDSDYDNLTKYNIYES